jgi:hypothetical protein
MSHGSAAKAARESKERHPELYCPEPRCLWRTVKRVSPTTLAGGPCPRHGGCKCDPKRPLPLIHDQGCPKREAAPVGVQPACGPCADARNLVMTSGYPAAPCIYCGGPTGRRLNAHNGGDAPNKP